ncbi:CdaR family protein [Pectinatus sottacetonis]|uniref:CdaR family protein n=1 Tax=Pectinatus sottacetonis TaxID=1002795 RepID=UPI0018C7A2AC|nr:CdaR family protein [Pectinatus sottacetonis]
MIKLFKHNLILKCISLFLALGLWLYVMNEQNPSITSSITIDLSVINAPGDYQILHNNDKINLKVKAPRSLFASINSSDFKAYVDLKNAKEGTEALPVHIQIPKGFELLSSTPLKVSFTLNKIIEKSIPVDLILSGQPANGMVVAKVKQSADTIVVKGPRPEINNIRRAVGYIGLDNNKEDFKVIVPLRAINSNNKEVSDVTLLTPTVNADISLARGLTRKVVTIKPIAGSDLPDRYVLDALKAYPDKVEITGDPKVISTVNFLDTESISLKDISSSQKKAVKIAIPEGITVSNDTVTVDIKISPKKTDKN